MTQKEEDNSSQFFTQKKSDFQDSNIDTLLNDKFNFFIQSTSNPTLSQNDSINFLNQYSTFFSTIHIQNLNSRDILINQTLSKKAKNILLTTLQQNGFIIMSQQKSINLQKYNLQIKVVFKTQFYDVVQILCQLPPFTKRYIVLNENQKSYRHQNKVIGFGSFGKLYCCRLSNDGIQSVVKCINYNENEILFLKDTIKEFFICDMMSALKVGPKILKSNGFDFILFQDCIEFKMERCIPCKYQSFQKDTKQNLLTMHLLQMIHFDIKPSNIMYSPAFKKNILLDFGISQQINEKWGTKTLIKFKGTYEFCSQQMKKIFMRSQPQFIDLYLNDVYMLENSFKFFQKSRGKQQHRQMNIKQDNSQKLISSVFEQTLRLKYHLYMNQFNQKTTFEFKLFLEELNKIQHFQDLQNIIKEGLFFAQKMSIFSLKKLMKEIIQKNPRLKNFQIEVKSALDYNSYDQKLKFNNIGEKDQLKFTKFSKIYHKLENQKQSKLDQNSQEKNSSFLSLKNIQYILLNKNELQMLPEEQRYELYLNYCTFWKPKFQVGYLKKQKASQILKQLIKKQAQPSHYIPKKNAKNYLRQVNFVYCYILSYCRKRQFTDFKQKYLMFVLKDCIILGIQYFVFMRDCVTYYYKCLIQKKSKKLITSMTIDFIELNFLTQNLYLITIQMNPNSYKEKYFSICGKQIIEDLIKYFKQSYQQSDQYFQKISVMQIFWETLLNDQRIKNQQIFQQQKFITNIKCIVEMLEKQFADHTIKEILSFSSAAISYIYFTVKYFNQIFQLNLSFQSILSKHYDNQIDYYSSHNLLSLKSITDLNQIKLLLQQFDKKIDHQFFSKCFFVPLRFKINIRDGQKYQTQVIIQKLLSYPIHPIINYEVILQIMGQLIVYSFFDDQQSQIRIENLIMYYYRQLLKFFFEQGQKIRFIQCLLNIKGSQYRIVQHISQQNYQCLVQTLKYILKADQHNQYKYLINIILLQLYYDYSIDYLKTKKQILTLFLQTSIKNTKLQPYQKYYFQQTIISNLFLQKQINQFWSINKLQFILQIDLINNQYLGLLKQFFVKTKNFSSLFQMILILNKKKQLLKNSLSFMNIFDSLNTYLQQLQMSDQSFDQVYQFTLKHSNSQQEGIRIFMLICILKLTGYLRNNLTLWKKLLSNFYNTCQQIKNNTKIQKIINKVINKQLYIFSYQFIKTQNKNNKKVIRMMRPFLKNKLPPTFIYQKRQYKLFEEDINKILNLSSNGYKQTKFHRKIKEKLQNYKRLSPINCINKNDFIFHFQTVRNQNLVRYKWYKVAKRNLQLMNGLKTRDYLLVDRKIQEWFQLKGIENERKRCQNGHYFLKQVQSYQTQILQDKQFVDWFINSQQHKLCQDIIDIIDEILQVKKTKMQQEINKRNLSLQLF